VVPADMAAEISARTSLFMISMGAGTGGDAQYLFAAPREAVPRLRGRVRAAPGGADRGVRGVRARRARGRVPGAGAHREDGPRGARGVPPGPRARGRLTARQRAPPEPDMKRRRIPGRWPGIRRRVSLVARERRRTGACRRR
jgi:hypothetical protein